MPLRTFEIPVRGQKINVNRSLEEAGSNPHGWVWRAQDLIKGGTADATGTARELKLEVAPEEGAASLQPQGEPSPRRSCFLRMSKESRFLGWNLLLVRMLRTSVNDNRGCRMWHKPSWQTVLTELEHVVILLQAEGLASTPLTAACPEWRLLKAGVVVAIS